MNASPARTPGLDQWSEARIRQALSDWAWAPAGTDVIETDDYRLLLRPEGFGHDAHVARVSSCRPAHDLIDEISRAAADRGYAEVVWSIYPTTAPPSLTDSLLQSGGTVTDEGALMSLAVPADGRLDVGRTAGVRVRTVTDAETLTHYRQIISTVYDQPLPSPERIADEAAGIADDHRGCRFVAYLDDQPVGTGAIAIRSDGSASLFGAATYAACRGRGAYRAILAARTKWAAEHAVPILLVSGRLATSAPIMQRVGFVPRGRTCNIRRPASPLE